MMSVMSTPEESAARSAGLRHVDDGRPGLSRRRRGRSFAYVDSSGAVVRDPETLDRIRALAIPPAWTDVWICPVANGHIQATGRDARGRKQYRYHARWREIRDETKYHRTLDFGAALPRIRRRVAADLERPGLSRERVLATLVRLLDITRIRIGNDEYARENGSFGLTTLRRRHVKLRGETLHFEFRGKSGRVHHVTVRDRRVARIVKRCQELPGQELFQYVADDGEQHAVSSDDVNGYLRDIAGEEFSAKDFRTWSGTVLAACALQRAAEEAEQERRNPLTVAVAEVAEQLGNTAAVCRRCYIHPEVVNAHLEGALPRLPLDEVDVAASVDAEGLSPAEKSVLNLLRRRLREAA
jgi:DNA topoisomerase-1